MTEIKLYVTDSVYEKIKDNTWLYSYLIKEVEEFLKSDDIERIALRITEPISEQVIEISLHANAITEVTDKYREWLLETEQYELVKHADALCESAKKKSI